jgi:hypothetical protein
MRAAGVALVLIARVAVADDDEDHDYTLVDDTVEYVTAADERTISLTTALSSRATGTTSAMPEGAGLASVRAEASAVEIVGTRAGYRFELGGEGELRAGSGDLPAVGGSWRARAAIEDTPLFDGGPHAGFCTMRFEMRRDYGALPALDDARELMRAPFDRSRYDAYFTFVSGREDGSDWSGTTLPLRFSSERTRQYNGDVAYQRQVIELELTGYAVCHGPDSDLFCVRLLEGGGAFASGARLSVAQWNPAVIDGIPLSRTLRLDARAGILIANYKLPAQGLGLPDDEPPSATDTCETLGTCVQLKKFGYELALHGPDVPHRFELGRRAYKAIGGEIAIEDRATLTTSWQRRRTRLDASAYVASTRWWTVIDDRFSRQHRGVTGGVDLSLSRTLAKRWRFDSTLSAGRSWYGTLDATTPQPGFAAQGTLALSHELRSHWRSLQRLRPAPPAI